jgi:hypothetical protein
MAPVAWAQAGEQPQASLLAEGCGGVACRSSRMVEQSAARPGKRISGGKTWLVPEVWVRPWQRDDYGKDEAEDSGTLVSAALHAVLLWPN